ncbi:hypothetical protein ACLB2K_038420 [Fragaria x ananassa]
MLRQHTPSLRPERKEPKPNRRHVDPNSCLTTANPRFEEETSIKDRLYSLPTKKARPTTASGSPLDRLGDLVAQPPSPSPPPPSSLTPDLDPSDLDFGFREEGGTELPSHVLMVAVASRYSAFLPTKLKSQLLISNHLITFPNFNLSSLEYLLTDQPWFLKIFHYISRVIYPLALLARHSPYFLSFDFDGLAAVEELGILCLVKVFNDFSLTDSGLLIISRPILNFIMKPNVNPAGSTSKENLPKIRHNLP